MTMKKNEKEIYDATCENAPKRTTKDISGIMKPQINTRIATETSPKENGPSYRTPTKVKRDKHPCTKSIGSMTGNETIKSSTAVTNKIHQSLKSGFVGWTKTVAERFTKATGETVGDEDDQSEANDE